MATYLPGSGALSINDINTLFGRGNNLNAYRGTTYYTSSSGPFSFSAGAISMSSFYGTGPSPNSFSGTISSNQTNLNLRTWALANGWDGSSVATITINSGVYVYSTSTGNAGLTINGSWPNGITVVNNGNILGMGGEGGGNDSGSYGSGYVTAPGGGNAISLGVNCTITNNGYIAGGGGGGAGGFRQDSGGGGGGAGGGKGGGYASAGYPGGAGGAPGSSGSDGTSRYINWGKGSDWFSGGGGGGRILPGTGGAGGTTNASSYGRGGGSGGGSGKSYNAGVTAAGGSGGSAGGSTTNINNYGVGAGGGGWGAAGGTWAYGPNPWYNNGGPGGKAIALNGYTATRNGSGTTYGAVS